MPRPYPEPSINDTTGIFTYANTVTDGWFVTLISIVMIVVFYSIMKYRGYRTSDSLMVSMMLSLVLSSFLWAAGLLAGKIMVILLAMFLATMIYSIFDN